MLEVVDFKSNFNLQIRCLRQVYSEYALKVA